MLSANNLLLGKLGSATTVGDQRSPWWYLPEITARCASCWEPRGNVLVGAGEKAMRCGGDFLRYPGTPKQCAGVPNRSGRPLWRAEVGDELLELSSLICAAEMFGMSCQSYWWTKVKIWKHHYLQAQQSGGSTTLGRGDDLEVIAGAHGLLSLIDESGGRSHSDLIVEFIQAMACSSLADAAQHLDSCG